MKQIILALMLAVAGIGAAIAANPIREGNMIKKQTVRRERNKKNHTRIMLAGALRGVPGKHNGVYPRPLRQRGADNPLAPFP